jgi:hypothetical protein
LINYSYPDLNRPRLFVESTSTWCASRVLTRVLKKRLIVKGVQRLQMLALAPFASR